MPTGSYFDWRSNWRRGAAFAARLGQRLFGRRGAIGLFGQPAPAEPLAPPRGEAAVAVSAAPRRAAARDPADPRLAERIERLRRRAVLDMCDQLGLGPLPGQLWRFVGGQPAPDAGLAAFFAAIGIDAARLRARDAREIARANSVLELLYSIGDLFDRVDADVALALEARLTSGDYHGVRVAAQAAQTYQAIARMEARWRNGARLAVFDRFIAEAREGLANPLAVDALGAERVAAAAALLDAQMARYDDGWRARRRYGQLLAGSWPTRWRTGPEADALGAATAAAETAERRLGKEMRLRPAEVDAELDALDAAVETLRGLFARIRGGAASLRVEGSTDLPLIEALGFFGFDTAARPSAEEVRRRFRERARDLHPDAAGAAGGARAHQAFIELNRHYDVLKMRL